MRDLDSFRVAIIGSGPSGFYAAEALLQSMPDVAIDLIERLPVPFGLVRYGVAPDHQKLKEVTRVFTALASDSRVNFIGNVAVGVDVTVEELLPLYDSVIVACGASADRRMSIPGEELTGCCSAVDFVGWYNGHPDHCHHHFDLSGEAAVIVGQGNVAIDICRVLAKSVDDLRKTDIAEHALETLASSKVKKIVIMGRRGPAQMKFTAKELRELGSLAGWDIQVSPDDLSLDAVSAAEIAAPHMLVSARNVKFLEECSSKPRSNDRVIEFRFLRSPVEVLGRDAVRGLLLRKNSLAGAPFQQQAVPLNETEIVEAQSVFRSIGYRGVPVAGLPFDASKGVIPNNCGRVIGNHSRIYVTGWIKRGPTGIIGTNRVDSIETVASLSADRARMTGRVREGAPRLENILTDRGVRPTSFDEWRRIDAEELRRGQRSGRVRSKITSIHELVAVAAAGPQTNVGRGGETSDQPALTA
ncbi:MAG TPA: FAD-dependent oxidoreductase [Pirellulales bacterium]